MDTRRLRLLPLAVHKLRYLRHLVLERRDLRNATSYVWATLFSRDAGLALQDPLYRYLPAIAPYPKQLEIEVTTACNLRCVMCEHTYWDEPPRNMSFDQFRAIVDQFPGLKWIGMTGIGSGFLNPDYMRMIRYMKQEVGCFVEFFDPFVLITPRRSEELVELGVNKVWVSMEAATRETYERIRVGAKFDRVMENIRALLRAKLRARSPIPELWFHFIINKHNVQEMEDYVDLVARLMEEEGGLSAPMIYWTSLLSFTESEQLVSRPSRERMRRIERLSARRGIFSVVNENVTCDKPMYTCTKWNEPFVLVTGHLQPCCALNEANDRPYQERHAFINVLEESFRTWWRGEEKRAFVRNLRRGVVNPVCKNCHIFRHPDSDENVSIRDNEARRGGERRALRSRTRDGRPRCPRGSSG